MSTTITSRQTTATANNTDKISDLPRCRERITDTTVSQFTAHLRRFIDIIDKEFDASLNMRQFVAENGSEKFFSGIIGDCYVSLTINEEGGAL